MTTGATPPTQQEYIALIVAAAPPISVEQRERIAALFRAGGQ